MEPVEWDDNVKLDNKYWICEIFWICGTVEWNITVESRLRLLNLLHFDEYVGTVEWDMNCEVR